MTSHTRSQKQQWYQVKGKLISRFGSLTAASVVLKCSTNAIRLAAEGGAPRVAKRMEKYL